MIKQTLTIILSLISLGACASKSPDVNSPLRNGSEPKTMAPSSSPRASQKALGERVSKHTISLAPATVHIEGYLASFSFYADLPKSGGRLGWNEKETLHISSVDSDYRKTGEDYTLPGYVVAKLLALPDDTLLVLSLIHI